MIAIVKVITNGRAMLIEWIVHRCRKVQLVKRHIRGREQYHDRYSED